MKMNDNTMFIPYVNNIYFNASPMPFIPNFNEKPPTLYAILNSIVNYGKTEEEKKKILELAKYGRGKIFNFDYELDESITKEDFEVMILNHFLMRRIGFETVTAFILHLSVKINEIMPVYNKMFNLYSKVNVFGDVTIKEGKNTRNVIENENGENNTNTSNENISDLRYSDTPQDRIEDIKNGNYMTEFNYNKNNNTSNSISNTNIDKNTNDNNIYDETITHTNLIDDMEKIKNINSIYTLIFKDLECLFYQLAD